MTTTDVLPDYLPARMLNEFVYCPRLFYYEWVDGVFVDNRETVEGSLRHSKIDKKQQSLPTPEAGADDGDTIHSRSVTLSSQQHGLIAKPDIIEAAGSLATPVDYKRGAPFKCESTGELLAWDTDRIQLAAQALVLQDNGYQCNEGVIYYVQTRQRVRVPMDRELLDEAIDALARARQTALARQPPPPLQDSPKCPRCSLVGVCLPDETVACDGSNDNGNGNATVQKALFDVGRRFDVQLGEHRPRREDIRRLVPARDDLRPLYLNTQGLNVGKSGKVLKIKAKGKLVQEVRLGDICQLNLMGNIQVTTQAIQTLCESEIPIAYFSRGGWFYGVTHGLGIKNIYLRREQFRRAEWPTFCLSLAKALTAGKIRNQRTMLQRNHVEPPRSALAQLKCMQEDAHDSRSLDQLLGIEGNAARVYFQNFVGMIKSSDDDSVATGNDNDEGPVRFDFTRRNRRPPHDPVNALLSLAYSVLAKDLTIVAHAVGFDPYLGFYHQPRFGRASLALDLMEPFRPLIADSAVLSAINTRMVTPKHFIAAGEAVAMTADGRKAFFRAYEQRMDTLVTHPLFGYRVNYRRILEIQTRLLARVLTGEMHTYPVFVTR